jgi:hypothetical protein
MCEYAEMASLFKGHRQGAYAPGNWGGGVGGSASAAQPSRSTRYAMLRAQPSQGWMGLHRADLARLW